MGKLFYSLPLLTLIFIAACTPKPVAVEREEGIQEDLQLLAGSTTKYYRFNKQHFERSLEEGKTIFLDYHANWCPICARENPSILAAFNELDNEDVIGYQVHFNDGDTNADDKEMAQRYGVTYQHTKVVINKDGEVALKSLEVFSKEKVLDEIKKIAGE